MLYSTIKLAPTAVNNVLNWEYGRLFGAVQHRSFPNCPFGGTSGLRSRCLTSVELSRIRTDRSFGPYKAHPDINRSRLTDQSDHCYRVIESHRDRPTWRAFLRNVSPVIRVGLPCEWPFHRLLRVAMLHILLLGLKNAAVFPRDIY